MSYTCGNTGNRQELPCINCDCESSARPASSVLPVEARWIDPNDKTQKQYLPWIGEPCLFAHKGRTYYGRHTGGSFTTGQGATARHFITWDCVWMPLPKAPNLKSTA